MKPLNKKLDKLLRKHLPEQDIDLALNAFISGVSVLLEGYEQDSYIIERSMQCMSEELNEINQQLREELIKNQATKRDAETNLVRLEALFDTVPEAMMSFYAGGAPRSINQSGLSIIGTNEAVFLSNSPEENLHLWLSVIKDPEVFRAELHKISSDNSLILSGRLEMKDGRYYQYYGVPEFLDGVYIGRSWCWQNITELISRQKKLEHQAFYDYLTQLPNRISLFKSLDQALEQASSNDSFVSVMFIDMDNFKQVNDIAGHAVGDQFIAEVAKRLRNSVDKNKIMGRLGGDEFLVIAEGTLGTEIGDIQHTIKQALAPPINIEQHSFTVTCSVGISVYPNDGLDAYELIRKADMAMYQAKAAGKNSFQYFDEKLEKSALDQIKLESKLRQAVDNKEFTLVYQPKVSYVTQRVSGVEALIRWTDSEGVSISPDVFIEIAESIGVIDKITKWVLSEGYKTLKKWKGTELEDLRMSVNISTIDLKNPHFGDYVLDLFNDEELDTSSLELELTESVLIDQCKSTKANLLLLRRAGIKLSIDDFGKGYSNFSYLQELNVDFLKIDRSIVTNIDSNVKSAAIARSIVDVGHHLDIEIVAEGVETLSENAYMKSIGCDYCQGYFYSKPLNQEDFVSYVKTLHSNVAVS